MSRIQGKIAIVTGATKGIGLAIAKAFLERGARVYICARNAAQVAETVESLSRDFSGAVAGSACDVGNYESVRAMVADAVGRFGGLDILVNNAGIGGFSHVAKMAPGQWDSVIDTNLSGVFYCCHEAVPLMQVRGGGYIINIGSLAGKNPFAGGAAYNATKFGLIGFSEALMQEVRHDHIRVSLVMPGSVNTRFGGGSDQDPATSWKLSSEDVAAVVVNLLEMDPRALASRVELRPSEPRK